jgi:hypothetical protein
MAPPKPSARDYFEQGKPKQQEEENRQSLQLLCWQDIMVTGPVLSRSLDGPSPYYTYHWGLGILLPARLYR